MTEAVVLCEGRTEDVFVRVVLAPALWPGDLFVGSRVIPTSTHGRGGALSGRRVVRVLRDLLRQRRTVYVTTFFDLYGLPGDFPGATEAKGIADPLRRASSVEEALRGAVVAEGERHARRFVPHIQPYEFEALLFSDPEAFPAMMPKWDKAGRALSSVRERAASPEHINDGDETHPSARLRSLRPGFRKVEHGVKLATRIGLERIRRECRHFDGWVSRLESLPPIRESG